MIRRLIPAGFAFSLLSLSPPAQADLRLCNRMSYVLDAAIGFEDKAAAATRGWFRIEPGQCRIVLQGTLDAERIYLHARALEIYGGGAPLAPSGHADLCVAGGNFVIAGARSCRSGQHLARFTEVKPAETEQGPTASLAEEADYNDEQARLAGIQRLLVLAGYEANPIDGVQGPKTEAALAQFVKDRKLAAGTATAANFFDVLIEAASNPAGIGFSWCNETAHSVMAAIGVEDKGAIVTRGWYRLEPGRCLRPDVSAQARRLYSFAEAVDAQGGPIKRGDKPLAWGGDTVLCTREAKFELNEHRDCAARGLTSAGFASVDLPRGGMTVRLREP
jgi:uncharacterized membrane protein